MKKIISLIKASMTEDMNLFKVSTKKKTFFSKVLLPIFLSLIVMVAISGYSEMFIEELSPIHMEFVLLTIFILFTSIMTIVEGIYKSGSLLFNCKDDNLLLSLPLKRSTVLYIRVLKFYIFELLYNSIFLLPAIIVYAIKVNPGISYYFISLIGLLLFPIVPIFISCILGTIISFLSSRFKVKNYAQTFFTLILLVGIMYLSYNINGLITSIAENASSINDFITKLYYPAGAFIELITNFKITTLLLFIFAHIILFSISIIIIGRVFFSINSKIKSIKVSKNHRNYRIKSSNQIWALIKKELNRFANSPVFIINAGFGLVLFIILCIVVVTKSSLLMDILLKFDSTVEFDINIYMPIILFALLCFSSFMTSITSSMISLEGKSFVILKSLPVKPFTIVMSKVLSALLIMIPCLLIGNIILFIKFPFDFISIILLLLSSMILPLLSELIGIMINLKYPRMDAKNDTEVVKQSMSSAISVFLGLSMLGITGYLLYIMIRLNISFNLIIFIFLLGFGILSLGLMIILNKSCDKSFENIVV